MQMNANDIKRYDITLYNFICVHDYYIVHCIPVHFIAMVAAVRQS